MKIWTERWGKLHAALPRGSAALEVAKALLRSTGRFPHFGLFQQGTAAVIVTTAGTEQLSFTAALRDAADRGHNAAFPTQRQPGT